MICPNCQALVADDATFCDSCNAILDASFLGDGITNEAPAPDQNKTRVKADPNQTRVRPADPNATRVRPADPNATRVRSAPEPKRPVVEDDEEEKRSVLAGAAPPPQAAQAFEDLAKQFRSLAFSEKLATVGGLALLLSLGLPWSWARVDGGTTSAIGLVTGAWPLAVLALAMLVGIFLWRHPKARPHRDLVLGGCAGLSLLSFLGALAFLQTVGRVVTHDVGGRLDSTATAGAAFGVYLGLAGAAAMMVGTVLSYLGRERLPE